ATFVWEGSSPATVLADFNHWRPGADSALVKQAESGVWSHSARRRRDTYMEYIFEVNGERVLDPLNPHSIDNGIGGFHNFLWMPDGAETPTTPRPPPLPRRGVTHHLGARTAV